MPERPAITPSITCKDIDKTYDYFTQVLGFAGHGKWPGPEGNTMHASVGLPTEHGQGTVMMGPLDMAIGDEGRGEGRFVENLRNSPETMGNGVAIWFMVPDVDTYHTFLEETGALIEEGPTDQFWGDRTIAVNTPDGYLLMFASPIESFEPPEGLGETDGTGATQATAPGTVEIELPGSASE